MVLKDGSTPQNLIILPKMKILQYFCMSYFAKAYVLELKFSVGIDKCNVYPLCKDEAIHTHVLREMGPKRWPQGQIFRPKKKKLHYFVYDFFEKVDVLDLKIFPCINSSLFYLLHEDEDI